jgi:hypothetical protein
MKSTYKAVEVSAPGVLRVVERDITEPGPRQVRIRVEACGICHTDAATVGGVYPGLSLPRVPGHEVVGRIEAVGSEVSKWKIGQRVGVGLIAGEDGTCEPCRRGDGVNCQNPVLSGVTVDGGYAEVMIAEGRQFLMNSIPQMPLPCFAPASQHTTPFATPACAAEIWWECRALVVWGTWVSNRPGAWGSVPSLSDADARRRNLPKTWVHISISTRPRMIPRMHFSAWAGPERFLQQGRVVRAWGRLCPVFPPAENSSW